MAMGVPRIETPDPYCSRLVWESIMDNSSTWCDYLDRQTSHGACWWKEPFMPHFQYFQQPFMMGYQDDMATNLWWWWFRSTSWVHGTSSCCNWRRPNLMMRIPWFLHLQILTDTTTDLLQREMLSLTEEFKIASVKSFNKRRMIIFRLQGDFITLPEVKEILDSDVNSILLRNGARVQTLFVLDVNRNHLSI